MVVADIELTCRDCNGAFIFSAGEQEFFALKGYTNQPTRCNACRSIVRPIAPPRPAPVRAQKPVFTVNCAECGAEATVPFKPTQGRPVLCNLCFRKR
ncbi:MAG: zinc-ribbon domain containing protein [Candidatus Sericytochromatia bacterium]|nr:zinc-ribbon domain containing protein [Candidatus Sericytochromatia bacterium]